MRTITLFLVQLLSVAVTTITTTAFVAVTPNSHPNNNIHTSLYQSAVIEDGASTTQGASIPVDKIRYVHTSIHHVHLVTLQNLT